MKKMKILSLSVLAATTLLLVVFFQSCSGSENDEHPETSYEIKVIDSCEYIYVSRRPFSPEFSLTHKGNCQFCTARHTR